MAQSCILFQMRDLTARTSFLLRKKLDNLLFWIFPQKWVPLYTSVTFSRMRYHHCVANKKWQDEVSKITLHTFFFWKYFNLSSWAKSELRLVKLRWLWDSVPDYFGWNLEWKCLPCCSIIFNASIGYNKIEVWISEKKIVFVTITVAEKNWNKFSWRPNATEFEPKCKQSQQRHSPLSQI